jgi:hypothetical protein
MYVALVRFGEPVRIFLLDVTWLVYLSHTVFSRVPGADHKGASGATATRRNLKIRAGDQTRSQRSI